MSLNLLITSFQEKHCPCGETCKYGVCQEDNKTCATNLLPPNCNQDESILDKKSKGKLFQFAL